MTLLFWAHKILHISNFVNIIYCVVLYKNNLLLVISNRMISHIYTDMLAAM